MFSWRTTHPVALKSIAKVPNQKVTRRPKCFSFFFFFFLFFRRASSNLRDSSTMVFAQNSSIFTEQCTSPSLFSRFEVTRGNSNCSLKNYGFLSLQRHFFFTCTHACMHCILPLCCCMQSLCISCPVLGDIDEPLNLSNEMWLLRKIAELEILLVCGECLKKACDSSANTA